MPLSRHVVQLIKLPRPAAAVDAFGSASTAAGRLRLWQLLLRLVIAASCAAPFGPLWQRVGAPSALFAATTPHHRWWQRTAGIGLGGRWWR